VGHDDQHVWPLSRGESIWRCQQSQANKDDQKPVECHVLMLQVEGIEFV
ncbi:MAG: hypothetical protein ACI87E_001099, partial [Mariniblastus sp.]